MDFLRNKGKLVAPTPVRFTEKSDKNINEACENLGLAKQDVIRLAVEIGLKHLEAVKYDIAKCVLDKSLKK